MLMGKYMGYPDLPAEPDAYVWFGAIAPVVPGENYQLRIFGKDFYRVYFNGEERLEGPARYASTHPEYDVLTVAGDQNTLSIEVILHYIGVDTRIALADNPPFLMCELSGRQGVVGLNWKCRKIGAYRRSGRRINSQLGWMEDCDARLLPRLGQNDVEDAVDPVEVPVRLGILRPKTIRDCLRLRTAGVKLATGCYDNRFGYAVDDLPVRFMLRDLQAQAPADGIWLRYDFQKIGLYRPCLVVRVPAGTCIEAGYSESLTDGRVCPVITLSASQSCNMDRWIAAGGTQGLKTFSPRGFRYMEVHVSCPLDKIEAIDVEAEQRTYFDQTQGDFTCSDPRLNQIWQLGAEALRACSEDALTDNPTRERGQWLGDAAIVGLETLSVAFDDYALVRRSLQQAAYCAREDGFVSGLYPGQPCFLTGSALAWVDGCLRYFDLTGDRAILTELYPIAQKTIGIFLRHLTMTGVIGIDAWDFLDWGHQTAAGEINVAINLMFLATLKGFQRWEKEIGFDSDRLDEPVQLLEDIVRRRYFLDSGLLAKAVPAEPGGSRPSGHQPEASLHASVFALAQGLLSPEQRIQAISFIKNHYLDCFPNNPAAPRHKEPAVNNSRLITPFFSHYALDALWQAGESEFVLGQYRTCWGWMLDQGLTTPSEVFDLRWSHCHEFSSCPTWQLSRHVLGLLPGQTGDPRSFRLHPQFGSLTEASGRIPLPDGGGIVRIHWRLADEKTIAYELQSDVPVRVRLDAASGCLACEQDGQKIDVHTNELIVAEKLSCRFAVKAG